MSDIPAILRCDACAYANLNLDSGRFVESCLRCRTRYLSTLPAPVRDAQILDIEKLEGVASAQQLRADVADAFVRRQVRRRLMT